MQNIKAVNQGAPSLRAFCRWASAGLVAVAVATAGLPAHAKAKHHKPADSGNAPASSAMSMNLSTGTGTESFVIEPVPKWVEKVVPDGTPVDTSAPMYFALLDKQIKVEQGTVTFYTHNMRVLRHAAGVENGSQLQFEFDPTYQTLAIHQITIWRDGQRIDKLDRKDIKILHRETQLERRIYDGRATASVVLSDVRAGDRIEYAYSLRGANPVFDGKFVDLDWSSASTGPVSLYQYRLIMPQGRAVQHRESGPGYETQSRTLAGQQETIVRKRGIAQSQYDPSAPLSAYLDDVVQFSEFTDWADVARWSEKLFARAVQPTEGVREQAARIAQGARTDEARVRKALDFVQTDIRYFGTEIGANSHLPAEPDTVLKQRYGDCKDKAALLVALLKALGIKADPVVVSTYYREQSVALLPSPLVFNHAITRVALQDTAYWLDGTRSHQTGELGYRNAVGLGKALVARSGETELSDLPGTERELRIDAEDTFRFGKLSEPPVLESRFTYHGELAEMIRDYLANQPLSELQKSQVNEYTQTYPHILASGPIQLQEDTEHNAVSLLMKYTVPDYLRFPQQRALVGDFAMLALMQPLRLQTQAPRTKPLHFNYPGIYRHRVNYAFNEDVFSAPASNRFDDQSNFFDLHMQLEGTRNSYFIQGELQQLSNTVEVADWQRYKEKLSAIWPRLVNVMVLPPAGLQQTEQARREVQALSEAFNKGNSKFKSQVQAQAQARLLILSPALDSGRLSPKLRAEALIEKGASLDTLGQPDAAVPSFNEAVRLDPQNAQAHAGLAVNALARSQDELAEREALQVLKLAPSDVQARYSRVFSLYFREKYSEARDELVSILNSRTEVERSYGALWLYMSVRQLGADGSEAIRKYMPAGTQPAWPYPVLQMLSKRMDLDKAISEAKDGGRPDPSKLCELYFYAGELQLLNGDKRQAKAYFQKSLDTGIVEYSEYGFAKRELARLNL